MSSRPSIGAYALLRNIEGFGSTGRRQLRPYQAHCAQAIARSVIEGKGNIFTVMFARQMGKNETSAQLEAYLLALFARRGGTIVKAAPSFKPQIINSILRLKETLDGSTLTRDRWQPAFGYMVQLGHASIAFFSADHNASVVGATASLLLEIDEAQDINPEKYDRDFRPMASSTNATTVLYGTAWGEDSILERQRRINLEHQAHTGEQLHFEYDWTVLAKLNPAYAAFVRGEIDRLGLQHPSVQTQYLLRCLNDAGRLFSAEQRATLAGLHARHRVPHNQVTYVAGIDVAGEDEQAEDALARSLSPRRDSTIVTIAQVDHASGQPVVRVAEHIWWTGRDQVWQFDRLVELWRRWNFARIAVDASGIGAGLASFLHARFPDRVERVVFTQSSKSRLGYSMLSMINTNRLHMYAADGSPEERQFWHEVSTCRYALRASETLAWSVPESEGHDDFIVSLALTCRAAEELAPLPYGGLVRPPADGENGYPHERWGGW